MCAGYGEALGTSSALSTCQTVQWQRLGLSFLPHSGIAVSQETEFSFIPIIRVPGQTNSLIQMSLGVTITFSLGFFLYF